MHPRSLAIWPRQSPTTSVTETLFGPDFEVEEYELGGPLESESEKQELKIDLDGGGS